MKKIITENLIKRYEIFKDLIHKKKIDNEIGKYWSNQRNYFKCKLTPIGPINLGSVNYLENEIEESIHKYNKNDSLIKINQVNFKLSPQLEVLKYYYDIIISKIKFNPQKIIEIGAGGGILCSMLRNTYKSKIVIVDIPDMLLISSAQLINIFPDARICFPNEIESSYGHWNYKFKNTIYLTKNDNDVIKILNNKKNKLNYKKYLKVAVGNEKKYNILNSYYNFYKRLINTK